MLRRTGSTGRWLPLLIVALALVLAAVGCGGHSGY
jgi:hypothetical protein